ncbi:MAG: threonine--tRNA ligase [Rickettsiales bacterium]
MSQSPSLAASHADNISLAFPDGAVRAFPKGTTPADVAASISPGLRKKSVAAKLDGRQVDLYTSIFHDANIDLIVADSEEGTEILRHDAAHLLAHAVKELFPDVQVTIGPTIENGFYYDFKREEPFSENDFPAIEARMREIMERNLPIRREVVSRDEAVRRFTEEGEPFKAELAAFIPEDQEVSLYHHGDFTDLCRGPHAESTGFPKYFKLTKTSGAYWRGDARNPMLHRIYGTAWPSKKELDAYITRLEEAERRDHRKIGAQMDLFHLQEEAQGQAFWHENGWTLYRCLETYIRQKISCYGYREIKTPILLSRSLWEKSGHWEKFGDMIFTVHSEKEETMAIKPMSCPGHVQIFNKGVKSYRDLPLRFAEFGHVHRNEPSGSLHGLMRARGFTQDDGHIFCTEDQLGDEIASCCEMILEIYRDLGFSDVYVKFSDRPAKRAGEDAVWDRAENALENALKSMKLEYTLNPGEGAFYGPKLEFVLRDAIGRHWQCGTVQVDFVLPERLGATYVAASGQKERPVLVHRALSGSFERFIGILIEHYVGHFPLWMAPVQAVVAPITDECADYARKVNDTLTRAGLRSQLDLRNEKISYKVKYHSDRKIPIILAVGKREQEEESVAVRRLGSQKQETQKLAEFIAAALNEAAMPS